MSCVRSPILASLLCFLGAAGLVDVASAQQAPTAKQEEEAEIRAELERIIKEDPAHAGEARKALDALNQPPTSRVGRETRNRRESGLSRIVNGLPSRSHPAVGAILYGKTPATARTQCTGTLVGCDKFLTAAHCIRDDPSPGS